MRVFVITSATLILALGLAASAVARPAVPTSPVPPGARPFVHANAAELQHFPQFTMMHWSTDTASLTAGFNDTDAVAKFKCAFANGCTILIRTSAQTLASVDGGQWAICTLVDGSFVNHSCYYQGTQLVSDSYRAGGDLQNVTVAKGNHTIHTQVYVDNASTLGSYQYDYEVTTP